MGACKSTTIEIIKAIANANTASNCLNMFLSNNKAIIRRNNPNNEEIEDELGVFYKCCMFFIEPNDKKAELSIHKQHEALCDSKHFPTEEEKQIMQDILLKIDDARIKALINDLLWLATSDRKYQLDAIADYLSSYNNIKIAPTYRINFLDRALTLSVQLGKKTLETLREQIFNLFINSHEEDYLAATGIPDLLKKYNYKKNYQQIAKKLLSFGDFCTSIKRYSLAEDYYSQAATWHYRAGEQEGHAKLLKLSILSGIAFAKTRPPHVLFEKIEKAIATLKTLDKKIRYKQSIDKIIKLLYIEKNLLRRVLPQNTMLIDFGAPEDKDIQNRSAEIVSGHEFCKSLNLFFSEFDFIGYDEVKGQAEMQQQAAPFFTYLGVSYHSRDLRHVGNTDGVNLNDVGSISTHQLMLAYQYKICDFTKNYLLPASSQINQQHQFSVADIKEYANNLISVPAERKALFAKGLYYGLKGQFDISIHLLAPQLENFIRDLLLMMGEQTRNESENGTIEKENALGTLIDNPRFNDALSPSLVFEIKYLFCSEFSANIRNGIAHGLVDDNICYTPPFVYGFWFIIKLFWEFSFCLPEWREKYEVKNTSKLSDIEVLLRN